MTALLADSRLIVWLEWGHVQLFLQFTHILLRQLLIPPQSRSHRTPAYNRGGVAIGGGTTLWGRFRRRAKK